jgi:hypothetical protein
MVPILPQSMTREQAAEAREAPCQSLHGRRRRGQPRLFTPRRARPCRWRMPLAGGVSQVLQTASIGAQGVLEGGGGG